MRNQDVAVLRTVRSSACRTWQRLSSARQARKNNGCGCSKAGWISEHRFPGCVRREKYTGQNWRSRCDKRSGIVFFEHYWCRTGESPGACTGNHIDLWDGKTLTSGRASFFRFTIGIDRIPNPFGDGNFYSDLNQSREVWFLPVS